MSKRQKDSTDDITIQEPATIATLPSADPPTHPPPIEPLDLIEEPKIRTKLRIYAILSALYLVLFVAALDQTIIATSIPTISAALHSATGYVWIGGAYLLANAASGPIWAKCSDIWGRKPALLSAVIIFAVASVLAATSTNIRMLIAARALQGTACGGLGQLVYITISDLFSVRKRAFYIGLMGLMWAVAGSTGPLIGGALTQLASWRWCFWINLPVCGVAFALLVLFLDVHNPRTGLEEGLKAVDWFGTVSILTVTLLILLGLQFGGAVFAWDSPKVVCLIVVGALMIGFFIYSEKRLAKYPLMPMEVFNNLSNNAIFLLSISHSMVAIGTEFYLPLYFQSAKQASPLRSGILIVPMMAVESTTDILTGIFMSKTGRYKEILWVGTTLMTLGTGLYINLEATTSIATIVGFEIVAGIGTALLFMAPTLVIQNNVTQADTATATATLGFARNMATALSIVLGGVVFQNSMTVQQSSLAAAGLSESIRSALSGDQAAANVEIIKTIQDNAKKQTVQDAFAWSIRNLFIMYTGVAGLALVASVFVKYKALRTEHMETKTGIPKTAEQATAHSEAA